MGPEMHHQLIAYRVAELHEKARNHRLANEAVAGKKARNSSSPQRLRSAFAKLRTS